MSPVTRSAPRDATTNPSLITAAAQMDDYRTVVDAALRRSREEIGEHAREVVGRAIDRLSVEFGVRILGIISGRVSTEVDARLSHETEVTVDKARRLIGYYEEAGTARDRVLIKIASTWEGIRAAERLEADKAPPVFLDTDEGRIQCPRRWGKWFDRGTWYRQRDRRGRREPEGRLESVPTARRPGRAPWRRGQRWSASRKRDVVLRLLRGASLEALSREAGVEIYRLDAWRARAMAGLELG